VWRCTRATPMLMVTGRGRSGSAVCGEDGELSSSARLQLDVLNVPSGLS